MELNINKMELLIYQHRSGSQDEEPQTGDTRKRKIPLRDKETFLKSTFENGKTFNYNVEEVTRKLMKNNMFSSL